MSGKPEFGGEWRLFQCGRSSSPSVISKLLKAATNELLVSGPTTGPEEEHE